MVRDERLKGATTWNLPAATGTSGEVKQVGTFQSDWKTSIDCIVIPTNFPIKTKELSCLWLRAVVCLFFFSFTWVVKALIRITVIVRFRSGGRIKMPNNKRWALFQNDKSDFLKATGWPGPWHYAQAQSFHGRRGTDYQPQQSLDVRPAAPEAYINIFLIIRSSQRGFQPKVNCWHKSLRGVILLLVSRR